MEPPSAYFIPIRRERKTERLRALREAVAAVDAMFVGAQAGSADVESIVKDFSATRKASPKPRNRKK
ncbi:MAG: hypothetical protein LKM39_14750 [Chiayiivirga sp.]|jgi:hypothetical protein|nr:hypothetical protein [Chiayiivirga sp.]